MYEVHKDCYMIEKLAYKQHRFVRVKCYEDSTVLFERFFG